MSRKLSSARFSSAKECAQSARVLLAVVDPAEQVVDAPLRSVLATGRRHLGVERVALEVEEEVAVIGRGSAPSAVGATTSYVGTGGVGSARRRRSTTGVGGGNSAGVPAGLSSCSRAWVRSMANVSGFMPAGAASARRERVDRVDPGGAQALALHRAHARHEQQIAGGDDLGVAGGAAPAGDDAELTSRVAPGDRRAVGAEVEPPVGDQRCQPLAAQPEDREQIVDRVPRSPCRRRAAARRGRTRSTPSRSSWST